jgi:hypothetical protein
MNNLFWLRDHAKKGMAIPLIKEKAPPNGRAFQGI